MTSALRPWIIWLSHISILIHVTFTVYPRSLPGVEYHTWGNGEGTAPLVGDEISHQYSMGQVISIHVASLRVYVSATHTYKCLVHFLGEACTIASTMCMYCDLCYSGVTGFRQSCSSFSCAVGDCLTSRPKGCSRPRELWFSIYSCTMACTIHMQISSDSE